MKGQRQVLISGRTSRFTTERFNKNPVSSFYWTRHSDGRCQRKSAAGPLSWLYWLLELVLPESSHNLFFLRDNQKFPMFHSRVRNVVIFDCWVSKDEGWCIQMQRKFLYSVLTALNVGLFPCFNGATKVCNVVCICLSAALCLCSLFFFLQFPVKCSCCFNLCETLLWNLKYILMFENNFR